MFWHGFILLNQPPELASEWSTILNHLESTSALNYQSAGSQPAGIWHTTSDGNKVMIESTFESDDLSSSGIAKHFSEGLSGSISTASIEGYIDPYWQAFSKDHDVFISRENARNHLDVYGHDARSPRDAPPYDEYYISPTGAASNTGASDSPWTLAHVLGGTASILQGDTIWMFGGEYGALPAVNVSGYSNDEVDEPLIFRTYYDDWVAGNPAIIGTSSAIKLSDLRFWGVVFTGTNTDRFTDEGGSNPDNYRTLSVEIRAPDLDFWNCIIHDSDGNGIGTWEEGPNSEIYGCLLQNNGWDSDDARSGPLYDASGDRTSERFAHGHNMYAQSISGDKINRHCLFLPSFGFTFTAHTAGGGAGLRNIEIQHSLLYGFRSELGWTGANAPVVNGIVDGCILWDVNFSLGQGAQGGNASFINNIVFDDTTTFRNNGVASGIASGNSIVRTAPTNRNNNFVEYDDPSDEFVWTSNAYFYGMSAASNVFDLGSGGVTFQDWKDTGRDTNSTVTNGSPTGFQYFVWPNEKKDSNDPRVGIVTVVNWEAASNATVDLSDLDMTDEDNYVFKNAFNYFGDSPSAFVSDGTDSSVVLTLTDWTIANPTGEHDGNAINGPLDPMPGLELRSFIVEEA